MRGATPEREPPLVPLMTTSAQEEYNSRLPSLLFHIKFRMALPEGAPAGILKGILYCTPLDASAMHVNKLSCWNGRAREIMRN